MKNILLSLMICMNVSAFDVKDLKLLEEEGECPGCDLSDADLKGMDLTMSDLSDANLSHADLTNTLAHKADFTNADLSNALFVQSNVKGSKFIGATLKHVDFLKREYGKAIFPMRTSIGASLMNLHWDQPYLIIMI